MRRFPLQSFQTRFHSDPDSFSHRAFPHKVDERLHLMAVYGAFTLIAILVFGTLSYHPF